MNMPEISVKYACK